MSDQFSIRPAVSTDRPQWELLWGGYLEFYESAVPASNTEILWQRILDAEHPIRCLLAAAPAPRSPLLGMVQFFPHLDTWEEHTWSATCKTSTLFPMRGAGDLAVP